MIILNELVYSENLLKNGFSLPYHKRFKDIFILVKYYKHIGKNIIETQYLIYQYLNKFDKEFNINTSNRDREIVYKTIHGVYNKNFSFRINMNLGLCKKELLKVNNIKTKQLKKLAILFYGLSRFYKQNKGLRLQYGDLCELIGTHSKDIYRLNILIQQLEKLEIIEEQEFGVFDVFNLEDEELFISELFKNCDKCGILISPTNNKNKYCADCAREIEKNNWVERKRKQREKEKCHEIENS